MVSLYCFPYSCCSFQISLAAKTVAIAKLEAKKLYKKIRMKNIMSDNFSRSNREKSKIAIAILEKCIIGQNHNFFFIFGALIIFFPTVLTKLDGQLGVMRHKDIFSAGTHTNNSQELIQICNLKKIYIFGVGDKLSSLTSVNYVTGFVNSFIFYILEKYLNYKYNKCQKIKFDRDQCDQLISSLLHTCYSIPSTCPS